MKPHSLVVYSLLSAAGALTTLPPASAQSIISPTGVPPAAPSQIERSVDVPNSVIVAEFRATGFQTYVCSKGAEATSKPEWKFAGPLASLTDQNGEVVGIHFGAADGPHWKEIGGGEVVGKLTGAVESSNEHSIERYRLVLVKNNHQGATAEATHIVRDDTLGGLKPARPCTAENVGEKTGEFYTAVYRAFKQLKS